MRAGSLFSPSDYTAALLMHIRSQASLTPPSRALELGTGSGVVLALMLALGAERAFGVDIEAAAVEATQNLLEQEGVADRAEVVRGDMWAACRNQQFDLIAANLPQFAAAHIDDGGRLPTWSTGGLDGRTLVNKFLTGLPQHLSASGVALMTHNTFIDVPKTQAMLAPLGLRAQVLNTASALLSPEKVACLNPAVYARFIGRGIHQRGEHWFAEFNIVEIRWSVV